LFVQTWRGLVTGQVSFDLLTDDVAVALYNDTITPNFSASFATARYGAGAFSTGQVVGPGYTAGGKLLTGITITDVPSGTLRFSADTTTWDDSVITDARAALIYLPTHSNQAVALIDFGDDFSSEGGDFILDWEDLGGLFHLELA
jgi:hypothetical protein